MSSDVELQLLYKIANAPINPFPFPHIYVRDIFPPAYYQALREHLPPSQALKTLTSLKRKRGAGVHPDSRLVLPLEPDHLAALPEPYRGYWSQTASWLIEGQFGKMVLPKFGQYLEMRFGGSRNMQFYNDALVVQDSTTYTLGPHTDNPGKVISFLFYLPADESMAHLGTSIYLPKDSEFRCVGGPHYPFANFRRVATMPYVPNALFAFLKTPNSFHGVEPITDSHVKRDLLLYDIRVANPPELASPTAPPANTTAVPGSNSTSSTQSA